MKMHFYNKRFTDYSILDLKISHISSASNSQRKQNVVKDLWQDIFLNAERNEPFELCRGNLFFLFDLFIPFSFKISPLSFKLLSTLLNIFFHFYIIVRILFKSFCCLRYHINHSFLYFEILFKCFFYYLIWVFFFNFSSEGRRLFS